MGDTYRAVIPYESMDPLTIGASDDDIEEVPGPARARDPDAQPARRDLPGRARARARRDRGRPARRWSRRSRARASRSCSPASRASRVIIDNQFRPTPSSKLLPPVLDAIEAAGITDVRVICANGKVFPMSESDIEQKVGRANLDRMERLGIPFFQNDPRNGENVHVRRRLLPRHAGVAAQGGREERGQDHDRPGAVEPLGRRRRRQADPAGRGLATRPSSRTTAPSSPRRRRTTAPWPARCARTSTRSRRCAASTAR